MWSRCWCPNSAPGDIVVMDNLSSHKGPAVCQAIAAAGAFMHRPTTSEPLVAGHCSDQDAAGGGGELHCPVEGGLFMYLFAQSSMTSITSRAFVPSIIMCVTPLNFPL